MAASSLFLPPPPPFWDSGVLPGEQEVSSGAGLAAGNPASCPAVYFGRGDSRLEERGTAACPPGARGLPGERVAFPC